MRLSDYRTLLTAMSDSQPESPLRAALRWWSTQDQYGGFEAVARHFFDWGWTSEKSCYAPHREDNRKSFSVYQNGNGDWRFNDFATGESGSLVGFVMLSGLDQRKAARWLIQNADGTAPIPEPLPSQEKPIWEPYKLTEANLQWQTERATELFYNKNACERIAAARKWKSESIEILAG